MGNEDSIALEMMQSEFDRNHDKNNLNSDKLIDSK